VLASEDPMSTVLRMIARPTSSMGLEKIALAVFISTSLSLFYASHSTLPGAVIQ
jgi:hypothetical protein